MSVAAVFLKATPEPRSRPRRGANTPRELAGWARGAATSALQLGYDEVVAVVAERGDADAFPDDVTVLLDESAQGEAGALHAALDWCARRGHEAIVVAGPTWRPSDDPSQQAAIWRALLPAGRLPIVVAVTAQGREHAFRLDASVWSLVPLEGRVEALLSARPELVAEAPVNTALGEEPPPESLAEVDVVEGEWASPEDVATVEALLGRKAAGSFSVVVRDLSGAPVVIRNAPFLDDATPMPTRFWLVGRHEREIVGRLESSGGVDAAEAAVDPAALVLAHRRYAAERDAAIPARHVGPLPSGGVGGTRVGVKCLHAHLAWYLAGGGDPVGSWVASKLNGELEGAVAAIDCGTNSTRLLVVARDGATLSRQMTVTRLGEGVDETKLLAPAAIERTVATLRRYRADMDAFGVVAVRTTATSAARDATNSEVFFDAAEAVLGVRPELLSGAEEGALSYLGATTGLDAGDGPFLVCDLGGGSTELVAGSSTGSGIAGVVSMNVGCVRITERFLVSDPPSTSELASARSYVRAAIGAAIDEEPALGTPRSLVGVAGTVSTLVALRLGLVEYDREALHHQRLGRDDVAALLSKLSSSPLARRRAIPGIEPGRADVIVGGALVLYEVMDVLGYDHLVYSEDDILDGLVASLRARAQQGS